MRIFLNAERLWSSLPATKSGKLFFFVSFVVSIGMLVHGRDFARLGFPLGWDSGIANQDVRFYVFEAYLLSMFLLALPRLYPSLVRRRMSLFFLALGAFFCLGLIFISLEIAEAPFQVLRNSAFLWYLSLPLILFFLPVKADDLENLQRASFSVVLGLFSLGLFRTIISGELAIAWIAQLGLMPFVFYALTRPGKLSIAFFWLLGLALGISAVLTFQRTALVGLMAGFCLVFISSARVTEGKRKLLGFFLAVAIGVFIGFHTEKPDPEKSWNPLKKAESTDIGFEAFRWHMWKDAWDLFRERPVTGIGFQRQVVHRIYSGSGAFHPNDGTWWGGGKPPVSGPHNSYLNALARMGILGACLAILHCWAFVLLWRRRLVFSACAILAQAIYAFFNVGLEGPVYCIWMLWGMGAAALVASEPMAAEEVVS